MAKYLQGIVTLLTILASHPAYAQQDLVVDPLPPSYYLRKAPVGPFKKPEPFDPVFGPWIGHHKRRIEVQWQYKPFHKTLSCSLSVSQDGEISDLKIEKTSHSAVIDKTALDIIKAAGPFRSLPKLSGQQAFLVEFLDYPNLRLTRLVSKHG